MNNTLKTQKLKTALIFSGGGSRFGYYMGIYKALCDNGKAPDIILSSCGGAYISGLISLCSDPKLVCEMMYSKTFYDIFCRFKPNRIQKNSLTENHLTPALTRWLTCLRERSLRHIKSSTHNQQLKPLPYSLIDSLKKQALYYIEDESIENPSWQTERLLNDVNFSNITLKKKTRTIIIASRTQPYESGFIWQQILRTDNTDTAKYLRNLQANGELTASISKYSPNIQPEMYITDKDEMPLHVAVRASINDMFYFPPISFQGHTLLGGIIDLLPIEIACKLADEVYVERKLPFDKWAAEPAILSVFGFYANKRRSEWHNFIPKDDISKNTRIHWMDTRSNRKKLPPLLVRKPRLFNGYIDIEYPSYDEFVLILKKQFAYGYQIVMNEIK